jgi:hypothetical protein
MFCVHCGKQVLASARFCEVCGGRQPHVDGVPAAVGTAAVARPAVAVVVDPPVELPLFPVATHKLVVLSICSFSLYEVYWFYQQWKRVQTATGEIGWPLPRAIFAPLWAYPLFSRIRDLCLAEEVEMKWSAGVLAVSFFLLTVAYRLPDPWWLVSVASVIPVAVVQRSAQRVNAKHAAENSEGMNTSYGPGNVATIVFGGLILLLAVIGTLSPD